MRGRKFIGLMALALCAVMFAWQAQAVTLTLADALNPAITSGTIDVGGTLLDFHKAGGLLANTCDYDWWYGCSPTSTGMMLGHYDRNGYASLSYDNLVPGGTAEAETHVGPPTGAAALANNAIASSRHVGDFYVAGYGASGDDVAGSPTGPLDCIADFMGTSQDACGNVNGGTTFYNWTNGAPFRPADAVANSITLSSGMYGVYEYIQYAGYDIVDLYNQYIIELGRTYGYTLAQYQAEIDAGRPVLIHIEGHTMMGCGYTGVGSNTIQVMDTWTPGPHDMTWGGSYSGMAHWGVTVLEVRGGTGGEPNIPEPTTLALLAGGLAAVLRRRRRS